MNDPSRMRGSKAVRYRGSDFGRSPPTEGRTIDCSTDCFASEQFSYEKKWRVLQFGIVDGHNVGVGKCRYRFRFSAETRQQSTVENEALVKDLNGNVAFQPRVSSPINLTHTASTD